MAFALNLFIFNFSAFESQNTRLKTIFTGKVRMPKSWPSKNQSEHSDLPQECLTIKKKKIITIIYRLVLRNHQCKIFQLRITIKC